MQDAPPFFFGYGSLVNRATHAYPETMPARLAGWRRIWRHTSARQAAYLSVVPAHGATIEGLIAAVPGGDWAALDAREAAYRRVLLEPGSLAHDRPGPIAVHLYQTGPMPPAPAAEHPILLSYLDVVVEGFLEMFGPAGVARFFDTTDGWHAPVLDDRASPRYPRHVATSAQARALTDDWLEGLACKTAPHRSIPRRRARAQPRALYTGPRSLVWHPCGFSGVDGALSSHAGAPGGIPEM